MSQSRKAMLATTRVRAEAKLCSGRIRKVSGVQVGPHFVVHKTIPDDSCLGAWTVTHRASGCAAGHYSTKGLAMSVAHKLSNLGFDWNRLGDGPWYRGISKRLREKAIRISALRDEEAK